MEISTKCVFLQMKEIKLVRKTDKLDKPGVRINRFGLFNNPKQAFYF